METHERRSPPATSSPLDATWLRISGKSEWRQSRASVYSVDWKDLREGVDSPVGYYHVVYTYKVEDERYSDILGNISISHPEMQITSMLATKF